jgi:uroporphyrinogen-III synthase
MKVLVTGEHDGLPKLQVRGEAVEWIEFPVIRFEATEVPPEAKSWIFSEPPQWIIFTSPRSVEFWKRAMGGLPKGSRLAAIGRSTADCLGGAAAFVPKQSGSEGFLAEFAGPQVRKGVRILIAGAEGGRTWLGEKLTEAGAKVDRLPLYRTLPREDVPPIPPDVAIVIFTSPSSVEALLGARTLPKGASLVSLGKFTSETLARRGLGPFREIPDGDWTRVGEVL